MKQYFMSALIATLLSFGAAAQTSPASPASTDEDRANAFKREGTRTPPVGIVAVRLDKTLNAKTARVGDEVRAKVRADLLLNEKLGAFEGSELVGHVSEVQTSSKDSPESRLGIVFDKAVFKDGREIAFHAVISGVTPEAPAMAAKPPSPPPMSGPSAMDRAAGPMTGPPGSRPEPVITRPPSYLEMQANDPRNNPMRIPVSSDTYLSFTSSGSVIISPKHNIKLDRGTDMTVRLSSLAP